MDIKKLSQFALLLLVFAILTQPNETGTNIQSMVSWLADGFDPVVEFLDALFNGADDD